jgi:amidophosphoribosyltransferase
VYGIDMPSPNELIAYGREIEEISELIKADGLIFQDITDLVEAVREENPEITRFETSVFDGNYITGDVNQAYLEQIDNARGESKNGGIQTELSNLEMHNIDLDS